MIFKRRWMNSILSFPILQWRAGEFLLTVFLNLLTVQSELQMVIGINVEIIHLLINISQKVVYVQIRSLCYKTKVLSVKSGLCLKII